MTDVWVVRNREGEVMRVVLREFDAVATVGEFGGTVTRETLLTPAQAAVIEAAMAFEPHVNDHGWERNLIDDCTVTIRAPDGERAFNALTVLLNAIATLRGLHGHAQSDCGHVWVDVMYGQYCKNCRAMRSVSQGDA